ESGMPGFEAVLHCGLLAPAGTPKEIVERLSQELRKLVDNAEVQKQIHNEGGDPLTSTPAEYAVDIDQEEKKWSGLVKKSSDSKWNSRRAAVFQPHYVHCFSTRRCNERGCR